AGAVWLGFHLKKSSRGEPRLIGTWQSDADATIADQRRIRPVTDSQEAALRKLFGRMKITYTETTFTTDFDGKLETKPYQVVRKSSDSVVIKAHSALSNQEEEITIRFMDPNTYRVEIRSELLRSPLNEYFKRVN